MRKSEMIKLLKQDINDADGNLDLQANMVLSRMLSCGMLPPPDRLDAITTDIIYVYYNDRVVSDDDYKPIASHLWEPEDEDVPYGKSVVEEVNADIKKLKQIVDSFGEM